MWLPSRSRPGRVALILFGTAAFQVFAASSAWADRPSIAALKWLDPSVDAVVEMTMERPECFGLPPSAVEARLAGIGRIAFRSPALLGGVAARVGMSCDSCHRNGHDNPAFFIEGVSGEPGTADVTGAVFSTSRDDAQENPVPIPTLVDRAQAPPFGTQVPAPDLRTFLHAAVVEEFLGELPPKLVFEGLLAYLRALRSTECPEQPQQRVSFQADAMAVLVTYDEWLISLRGGDQKVQRFFLRSLRSKLEEIYQRFPEGLTGRERLVDHSRALVRHGTRLGLAVREMPRDSLAADRESLVETLDMLGQLEAQSYYDPGRLRRALESTF